MRLPWRTLLVIMTVCPACTMAGLYFGGLPGLGVAAASLFAGACVVWATLADLRAVREGGAR